MSEFSDFFVEKKVGARLQLELEITDLNKFDELMLKIGTSYIDKKELIEGAKVSAILFKGCDYRKILEQKQKAILDKTKESLDNLKNEIDSIFNSVI